MFIVAIVVLATTVEQEAPLLAADLSASAAAKSGQVTAYEAGIALRSASPAVVLRTNDRARALDLVAKLRARGHEAVASDQAAMIPSHAMVSMRRLQIETDAIVVTDEVETRLPFGDILVMLRASHRVRSEVRERVSETKLRPATALLTGGMVATKTVTREVVTTSEEKEPVLYLFRRSGERPWLLHALHTHYATLGNLLRPTQLENFQTTVKIVRERATSAAYDERLLHVRTAAERADRVEGADGIDMLANLLALWYVRRGPSAYRG